MLRTDVLDIMPRNDPATAIVVGMETRNVDTVIVAGHILKRDGALQYVDWEAVRRMAFESRDFVIDRSGFRPPNI